MLGGSQYWSLNMNFRTRPRTHFWATCAVLLILVCTALWFGYVDHLDWIGFADFWITKHFVVNGQLVNALELQRQKTLWDWMQLLVIPVALTVGGFIFNQRLKEREAFAALDAQREVALQKYFVLLRTAPGIRCFGRFSMGSGRFYPHWPILQNLPVQY
jgi:hypothetical protein